MKRRVPRRACQVVAGMWPRWQTDQGPRQGAGLRL